MPFFKRKDSKDTSGCNGNGSHGDDAKTNGNSNGTSNKEKVNYKSRLEHKMYLVRIQSARPSLVNLSGF